VNIKEIVWIPAVTFDIDAGWKIDGSKVQFWATKAGAKQGVRNIGWPIKSIVKVHTRFCIGWAIWDSRFGILSKESFEKLAEDRLTSPNR